MMSCFKVQALRPQGDAVWCPAGLRGCPRPRRPVLMPRGSSPVLMGVALGAGTAALCRLQRVPWLQVGAGHLFRNRILPGFPPADILRFPHALPRFS